MFTVGITITDSTVAEAATTKLSSPAEIIHVHVQPLNNADTSATREIS